MGLIRNSVSKFKNNWKSIVAKVAVGFLVLSIGSVAVFRFVPVLVTPLMLIRSVASVFGGDLIGIEKDWVSIEEISPAMRDAVVKTEDYKFYEHNGFDFEAIQKAREYNRSHPRKKGASTISQQTAKNVFLWPSRSWVRKGFEAYFTVLIELMWPKERILEVYLNVIELGPGVYGVEAASQRYFKRSSRYLNSYQAARIAAVLPNPNRFRIDRPSNYVLKRQMNIMARPTPALARLANIEIGRPAPAVKRAR
jgi:monofunctional biosynthetic peptidoglycan transglycosylase